MVSFTIDFNQICFEISADFPKYGFHRFKMDLLKYILPIFSDEDQMDMKIENAVPA